MLRQIPNKLPQEMVIVGGKLAQQAKSLVDIHTPIHTVGELQLLTADHSRESLDILRHSTAHLMASAVQRLFPDTQVTVGPAIEDGFYYDFYREKGFSAEHLAEIEQEMQRLAELNLPFKRVVVSREEAKALFLAKKEFFKCEILERIPVDETITLYQHGEWLDLCRGPHVPHTGMLKAFKLTHLAGAYWQGDEKKPMLTRVYGTAFWDKPALEQHLHALEEAKKRDHRIVGRDLGLFVFDPSAPATPFFLPHGAYVYHRLVELIRTYYEAFGFQEVITPQLFDTALFRTSGHYDNYHENMYFIRQEEREFGLKPMNCPSHALLFSKSHHSYRDLPLRYADFGRLHRYERSGVVAGLLRVRSFCQDDAHIFCRESQIGTEIAAALRLLMQIYQHFGFVARMQVSTRPEQSLGRDPNLSASERQAWDNLWEKAEALLIEALQAEAFDFGIEKGEGAFYGPKIDVTVRDALGRWHQLGTIQLDFALPRRFSLQFTNEAGHPEIPVMIHRAILGSIERFMAILIEHCAGNLPVWLSPVHVVILPVVDEYTAYAADIASMAKRQGLRVEVDGRSEKLGFKIRAATVRKVPAVWVVGQKEKETGSVAVRLRGSNKVQDAKLDQAIADMLKAARFPAVSEV
jgi:threonyl-tRNA synthetase